ncbi:MAG TPA: CHASE2 domain-containing protein [Candidatus Obscuribacterales bacterium]
MSPPSDPSQLWQKLARASWQRRVIPGVTVIGLLVGLRLLGGLQALEWKAFDSFLRFRPAEAPDDRILIVGINEQDIQQMGTYPIPDGELAQLITRLQAAQPRAIGLDIVRDLPVEPGHRAFNTVLQQGDNIFGIEKVTTDPIAPPPALPLEQVGFNDFPLDADGFVRRGYLGIFPPPTHPDAERFRLSFPLLLAEAYLATEGLTITNGRRHSDNMRLGEAELVRFAPHAGGYVGADASGVQMLINVRSGQTPFTVVSMGAVLAGQVEAELIRDRVVIIGITSLSQKDLVNSAAVNTLNPGLVYGVEMHAHITSQILSAVGEGRPLIGVWADGWEYAWIVLWGGLGMVLVRFVARPAWYLLTVGAIALALVGVSWAALWLGGWWLPILPTLIAFTLNGLVLPGFYLYDQTLRSRIAERQRVIEETYDAIHNGPLQALALLLKQRDTLEPAVTAQLTNLNQELRAVYNRLQQESLPQADQLQLGTQRVIDLRAPLHEVLYEVYTETLQREFPGFATLKFQVIKFEPMQETGLTPDERRSLCRLLEEMLCNVGKHAVNAKRLTVDCYADATANLIRVADNGKGSAPAAAPADLTDHGRGTQQALALAHHLGGSFQRTFQENGTVCEIRWPLKVRRRWWRP